MPLRAGDQHQGQDENHASHLSFTSRYSNGILRSWTAVTIDSSIFSMAGAGGGRSSPGWTSASCRWRGWKATVMSAVSLPALGEMKQRVVSPPLRTTDAWKGSLEMSSGFIVADDTSKMMR